MILLVDDTPENLISLTKVLELGGFKVDTAASGEEALRKVLKNEYVLIILDVQMPGMDGFEVAEAITGFSKAQDTAIIFLSAVSTDTKFITKGYSSGGLDYITKPVDINILLLKVRTFYRIYEQNHKLQEMQRALKAEIEIRKDAERRKDEFISIASHELKTPLTSIKGYLQLVKRGIAKGDTEMLKKHVEKTQLQVDKLSFLVADLLDISKIESGKLKFNFKAFNVGNMLNDAVGLIMQTNPEAVITLEGETDAEIIADEVRIEQVVINFMTNAIKYSPGENEVKISCYKEGEGIKVCVADRGLGISEDLKPKVFEKFYRVEETSARFEGLGIGLYICSEIIRRHGGIIGVKDAVPKGTEFYFWLPEKAELQADAGE